jgi:pimeloyl-ACP methyl ester carboxylesterase
VHVLRFDYQGTGDSAGDDSTGQLDLWQADILAAHHELQRRAMCQHITWLGIRLGASLAALASTRTPQKPQRLLLWEPIADGPSYLKFLSQAHGKALISSYGLVPKLFRSAPRYEAMGFGLSPVLHEQLATLNASSWPALRVPELTLITPSQHGDQAVWTQWLARHEGQHQNVRLDHAFDWTSEEALNTALVPHDALALLASLVLPGEAKS